MKKANICCPSLPSARSLGRPCQGCSGSGGGRAGTEKKVTRARREGRVWGRDRRMSGHPNGGEQRLCKITGHQAPLVWFFERARDLNSACPCSTSSSTTWARHSPSRGEGSTSQVIFSTEQGLRGGVASRSQPTRVSATALGRGWAHPLPAGAFRSVQNCDSGGAPRRCEVGPGGATGCG